MKGWSNLTHDTTRAEELAYLNQKLKKIITYDDLMALQEELDTFGQGYVFVMKRTRFHAYSFAHMYDPDAFLGTNPHAHKPEYKDRVRYLISDGKSKRESDVKYLHRNIEVSDTAR